jgi:hypothetical protein
VQRSEFRFTRPYRLAARPFGITPQSAWVQIDDQHLLANYGPWRLGTTLATASCPGSLPTQTLEGRIPLPSPLNPTPGAELTDPRRGLALSGGRLEARPALTNKQRRPHRSEGSDVRLLPLRAARSAASPVVDGT